MIFRRYFRRRDFGMALDQPSSSPRLVSPPDQVFLRCDFSNSCTILKMVVNRFLEVLKIFFIHGIMQDHEIWGLA